MQRWDGTIVETNIDPLEPLTELQHTLAKRTGIRPDNQVLSLMTTTNGDDEDESAELPELPCPAAMTTARTSQQIQGRRTTMAFTVKKEASCISSMATETPLMQFNDGYYSASLIIK